MRASTRFQAAAPLRIGKDDAAYVRAIQVPARCDRFRAERRRDFGQRGLTFRDDLVRNHIRVENIRAQMRDTLRNCTLARGDPAGKGHGKHRIHIRPNRRW